MHFIYCAVRAWVRSNEWNTMAVAEAFCLSRSGSFGNSVACRVSKCVFRVSLQ